MISEAIVNLHRPYFIRAMQERPDDPTQSTYGQAFLSVIERSNVSAQRMSRLMSPLGHHSDGLWVVLPTSQCNGTSLVDLGELRSRTVADASITRSTRRYVWAR